MERSSSITAVAFSRAAFLLSWAWIALSILATSFTLERGVTENTLGKSEPCTADIWLQETLPPLQPSIPRHLSPTMSFTRPGHGLRHWKKLTQLDLSSFIPAAPRTSRYPSSFTAIATRMATFQTLRPSYGAGRSIHIDIRITLTLAEGGSANPQCGTYAFSCSRLTDGGGRHLAAPARASVISSTRRTDTRPGTSQ